MSAEKLSRDDDPTAAYPAVNEPAAPLNTAASGDRCGNCQTPLASDQRYCVSCGERRGRARFGPTELGGPVAAEPVPVPARESRFPRASSGTALIAFVATLLVAIALGVLIGHDSNSNHGTASAARPVYKITVNGGGSGAATGAATAGTSSGAGSSASAGKSGQGSAKTIKSKPVTAAVQRKVAAKGAAAASKTLGGSSSKAPAAGTQVGGKCVAGSAGCQGGKYTGNLFGPGS